MAIKHAYKEKETPEYFDKKLIEAYAERLRNKIDHALNGTVDTSTQKEQCTLRHISDAKVWTI